MKRYLGFLGAYYYASGGINDFISAEDTIEECLKAFDKDLGKNYYVSKYHRDEAHYIQKQWEDCWAHVFDSHTQKIVWTKSKGYLK